jgi:plasmid stabilization system protein ParE
VKVRFVRRAERQVDVIDEWWREHRPAAPSLFTTELEAAVALLRTTPHAGAPYAAVDGVFRLLLPKSRYWIYYRLVGAELQISAVWHAQRGHGPSLR